MKKLLEMLSRTYSAAELSGDGHAVEIRLGRTQTPCTLTVSPHFFDDPHEEVGESAVDQLPGKAVFSILLPLEVEDEAMNQFSSLLHTVNYICELPGFVLDENEGCIYYRYIHFFPGGTMDERLISTVLAGIQMQLDLFLPVFQKVLKEGVRLEDASQTLSRYLKD